MDSLGDKLLHLLPRNMESSGIEMNTVYVCIWQEGLTGLQERPLNMPEG